VSFDIKMQRMLYDIRCIERESVGVVRI